MMMRYGRCLAVAAGLAATTTIAAVQEIGRPRMGLALAQRQCAECHAIGQKEVASPNPAAPRFAAIAGSPGMSATALHAALSTSHRTMPNIVLDPAEMRDVVAYILSLKPGG
jgi:mono/diheme cytochrome c family protein